MKERPAGGVGDKRGSGGWQRIHRAPSSTTALIAHAAGWTLLHFLWQGALVALILACILALLSGRSAQPRYLAACAALVLMATLPLITFARIVAAEHSAANTFLISI